MKAQNIISIIIPCYNTFSTLDETLRSVHSQSYDNWEAIIVNDGSPDNLASIAKEWVKKDERFRYFEKENGGLGSARNYGIKKAKGDFILPLDSDNKVRPLFVEKAINSFKANQNVGVVYGNAMYFGEKKGVWTMGNFNKYRLMDNNYIDACAVIKASVFDEVGLYDEDLPFQGHEDWEFWLRVITSKHEFLYMDMIAFDYRVDKQSMINSFDKDMMTKNTDYIKRKHFNLYMDAFSELLIENNNLKSAFNERLITKIKRKFKY